MMRRVAVHVLQDVAVVYAWYFGAQAARLVAARYAERRRALRFGPVDPSLAGRIIASMFEQ